jgi:bifunctional ADP-heptose synthase (sugar kinase/adenylyltransferase)
MKTLLIGESCIDEELVCEHTRNSPEDASVPVYKVTSQERTPGMVALVSKHLNIFELPHSIITNISNDIVKQRIYNNRNQTIRIDYDNAVSLNDVQMKELKNELVSCDAVVVSDYGKGLLDPHVIALVNAAGARGTRVYLDPHPNNSLEQYRNLFVVKMNDKELEAFTGLSDLKRGAQLVKGMTGAKHVFITLGKNGIYHLDDYVCHYSTSQVSPENIVSVSGAGDVVLASIVADMQEEKELFVVLDHAMKRAATHVEGRVQGQSWPLLSYMTGGV